MYRAVTLYALEHGAIRSGIVDEESVVKLLDDISITFRFNPERGASDIYVNGDRVEGKIRTIEVSNCVSRRERPSPRCDASWWPCSRRWAAAGAW